MHFVKADDATDVARADFLRFLASQAVEFQHLNHHIVDALTIALQQSDFLPLADLSRDDSANADAADVLAVVDGQDERRGHG